MSDIVERLRDYANWTEHVSEEAADEIERLTVERKQLIVTLRATARILTMAADGLERRALEPKP